MSKYLLFQILVILNLSCLSNSQEGESYDELILKGNNLAIAGKIDEAIVIFKQALKMSDKRVEAYYGLGFSYMRNCEQNGNDCDRAIKNFDKALQIDSVYRRSYYNRAICRAELGDYKGAINDATKQISLDNTDPDYFHNRAVYKLFLGDTIEACKDYKRSFELGNSFDKESIDVLCK